MCGHAASGKEITGRLSRELYPLLDRHILAVVLYLQQSAVCAEAGVLFDLFYRLKTGFEILKEYNIEVVFPAVLSVFDTKDRPGDTAGISVAALQQESREKEDILMQLVSEMEQEAELLQLPEDHPVFSLLDTCTGDFVNSNKEWHRMLQGWNSSCACFAAAQERSVQQIKNTATFENR